jgi:hypothetical protein
MVYVAKPSNRSTCAVRSLRRGPSIRRYGGMRHTGEASSNAHHISGAACTRRGVVNLLPIDMSSWQEGARLPESWPLCCGGKAR